MEKIVLLNLPGEKLFLRDQYCSFVSKADYLWPPLDLLVQSGVLSQDFEIKIIDAIALKMSYSDCLKILRKEKPKAILFLSGTASWKSDFEFLKRAKKQFYSWNWWWCYAHLFRSKKWKSRKFCNRLYRWILMYILWSWRWWNSWS